MYIYPYRRYTFGLVYRWCVDTRPFPIQFLEKSKKGKNGKHMEWREFKEPRVLHVTVPAVAVKRPTLRGF